MPLGMVPAMSPDVIQWILTVIGVPAIASLFALVLGVRSKLADMAAEAEGRFAKAREERITQIAEIRAEARAFTNDNRRACDMQQVALRDEFKGFQIRVFEEFVPYRTMKEFETRIMALLEKMDAKMDKIADRASGT